MRALLIALALGALAAPALADRAAPEPVTSLAPGMVGAWFPPASDKDGLILVLGGSEGGLRGAQPLARRLSEHGFGTLAVAYFDAPGLPAALKEVPLEGVEAGVDWLRAQPGMARRPIAVVGVSKGGELALLIASRDPRLCAVVAGVPSDVVWAGIDMKNPAVPVTTASWSWRGKPLAFVPYAEGPFRGVRDLYERSLPKAAPDAFIPVEKIRGPVLMISGKADQLWPSTPMADAVTARLDAHRFAWPHTHLAYDNAGHASVGPPLPADSPNLKALAGLGGTPEGNNAARADGWPKILAFLDDAFAGRSCRVK
ncbi:MAG: dienelactone hydrolase [Proteobacteria bacterium]|nr:dienelactone hydrolase [Pseudomonadota bacterium]